MNTRILLVLLLSASWLGAAEWYVGPWGKPDNNGSLAAPWDLASALDGRQKIAPGDTIWVLAGTYRHPDRDARAMGFAAKLAGTTAQPIKVRVRPGERATLDGGLVIQPPATSLWICDLEILVSENLTQSRVTSTSGSHPGDLDRPHGGLNVMTGANCKYINLVLHDNAQGCSFWTGAKDSELYGCLIYNNGWQAPDRGHGHCIYTQNDDGVKHIASCIMTCLYDGQQTVQAYGSKNARVNNYLFEDNIAYDKGRFLIGGQGGGSHNLRALRNYLYKVGFQLGYSGENEDCEVRDNVVFRGGLAINKFKTTVNEGNLVITNDADRPKESKAFMVPNRYDPARANLAVFNWGGAEGATSEVAVKATPFLKEGESFRLMDPKDFFGKPVFEGRCQGDTIKIPVRGEFGAFVVLKN